MTYSKEDAIALKGFYSDKMIGRVLEESTGCKVSKIDVGLIGNGRYAMRAICFYGSVTLWSEISDAAKELNLPLPEEILSKQ